MAEHSDQEKTEDPTPRKRDEARNEGKIPRSQELTTAMLLLGGAVILNSAGPALGNAMLSSMRQGIALTGAGPLDGESAVTLVRSIGGQTLAAMSAMVLSLGGVALVVSGVQARGVLTLKPLTPDFKRISPLENGKRMLGAQPWVDLLKSLMKLSVVSIAVYVSLTSAWDNSLALVQQSPRSMVTMIQAQAVHLLRVAGLCYLAFAALDYLYQMWEHEKKLRMSREEVKQEHKQSEGDPNVKAQRRAMGRSYARRQMFQQVPEASVVITNPTHIAVALKYDPAKADAPVVLAMGQRKIAERIKQIARDSGVPTVENKPLARALLASAKVGMLIPPELYVAVAEVLAFVMSRRNKSYARS